MRTAASGSWSTVFCKDFVDISYDNASFGVLEDSIWLDLIYFLVAIDGDNVGVLEANKNLTLVFIAQISHYEKFTALHKLISNWRIKSSKHFQRNHALPGLFFKNCSGDEGSQKQGKWLFQFLKLSWGSYASL